MKRLCLCPWCHQEFRSNPRLGLRQKSCGNRDCRRQQKNLSHSEWKSCHTDLYRAGLKDWRIANPDYWRDYRAAHPQYTEKNRRQTSLRSASLRQNSLQKRIDILQPIEKQSFFRGADEFAKENRYPPATLRATRITATMPLHERPP